jgi:uncharacterized membrane-anchored protein
MTLQPLNKEALSKIPEVTLTFWIIKIVVRTNNRISGSFRLAARPWLSRWR